MITSITTLYVFLRPSNCCPEFGIDIGRLLGHSRSALPACKASPHAFGSCTVMLVVCAMW